jgi:hypothetical protein
MAAAQVVDRQHDALQMFHQMTGGMLLGLLPESVVPSRRRRR